ncbi:unnamed protein product [Caretta caretta]
MANLDHNSGKNLYYGALLLLGGGYSVIFLLETHKVPAVKATWQLESGDRVYFSHFSTHLAGVATLFSPELQPEVLGVAEVLPERLLHVQACVEGLILNLANIYTPNTGPDQVHFYRQVLAFLGTLDPHECLVLGRDFNTTLEDRDRSGLENSPAAVSILREIMDHHSLVDVWHDHHPDDDTTFTYVHMEDDQSCHSRLDQMYLSRFHLAQAHASSIWPAPFTDHHFVTVMASLSSERPGLTFWHFNNSVLEDVDFVASFQELWLAWRRQRHTFPSSQRWWDVGKVRKRLFC